MLPNFLIIGTAKSGTTTISKYLSSYHDVSVSKANETNFFAFDHQYRKGINFYENYFSEINTKLAFEKSWRYTVKNVYPDSRERILKHLGNKIKLVYIVRNPIDRVESLWMEFRNSGQDLVSDDFNKALKEEPIFLDSSLYWTQIRHYLDVWPNNLIKIMFFEDLIRKPEIFFSELCDFLKIETQSYTNIHENISAGKIHDRKLLFALRKIPYFGWFRDIMPGTMRREMKNFLKKPIQKPQYDAETLQWFRGKIYSDVIQILNYTKKPSGFWNLRE